MNTHQLILTSDYEIYGNGSGDIDNCLIRPTEQILEICDARNIRICFFVDVCEIWSMEEEKSTQQAAERILEQMKKIILSGHDIQLHLHPQWIGARFKDGKWELNYEYWRLPEISDLDFGEYGKGVYGLINKGKNWLEERIRAWDPEYACRSFRAGAWCIQPEEEVLRALKELGFKKDTSVAPGMKFDGKMTRFDFSSLKNMPGKWPLGSKLSETDKASELQEIPIATAKCGISEQLRFTRLKKLRKNPVYPENSGVEFHHKESTSMLEKARRYLLPAYRMLDFASGSTFEEMKFITKRYMSQMTETQPIVAISHPKNFGDSTEFEVYLKWCSEQKELSFEKKEDTYFWR